MKFSTLTVAAMLAVAAQSASAAPNADEREGALMLYFSKSFGGGQDRGSAPLAFGLRLAQVSTVDATPRASMLDASLSLSGRTTLKAMGMPMFDSALPDRRWFSSFASSGGIPTWGKWMLGAALMGGGMCLAEWVFCEDSDSEEDSTYTPGNTG